MSAVLTSRRPIALKAEESTAPPAMHGASNAGFVRDVECSAAFLRVRMILNAAVVWPMLPASGVRGLDASSECSPRLGQFAILATRTLGNQ